MELAGNYTNIGFGKAAIFLPRQKFGAIVK
jgi:hypothetical protein